MSRICLFAISLIAFSGSLMAQDTVFVISLKASSTVALYTPEGKPLATVPVGKHPHELAISADGRYAYTTDNGTMAIEENEQGNNTVSVIDLKARKRTAVVSLGDYFRPHGIDVHPVTGNLLVTTENPARLVEVDPRAAKVVRTYEVKGDFPHIVTIGKDGKWAYVSNARSNAVSVIELASGAVTLIPVGERPEGSVLSKDGSRLYVANRNSNEITVIDTEKKSKISSIKTGDGPVRITLSADGRYAIYGMINAGAVGFADLKAGKEVAQVSTDGKKLVSMHISHDGKWALTGAFYDDEIYVIDIANKKVHHKFKVPEGSGPDPIQAIAAPK